MPSHFPHASRPSAFRAPGWGAPRCLCLVVGGAQPCGGWYLSAIARLQGFSSGSPAASPHQWSPKTVTTSLMVGRSKPGCGLCPTLSFKDLHHPCWGGGRGEPGPAFAWAGVLLLPPASEGRNHPPALRRRRPPAMPGKANCCCPARVQHSVLCPGDGGQPHRGVSQHVVCREDGTRVLGRSHSRFHGEDGSEDLPVCFGAPGARWCGVGGQVDATAGAEVVAAGESFLRRRDRQRHPWTDLLLFGFNVWFSSLEWGREREPSSGSVRPGTIAAAAEVAGESPRVCRPAGSPMWRLFIPARVEPKFRL
jgi:hypothetical protein